MGIGSKIDGGAHSHLQYVVLLGYVCVKYKTGWNNNDHDNILFDDQIMCFCIENLPR